MFYFEAGILKITNYSSLKVLNEKEVVFIMKNYRLEIRGENIFISFFERYEVHIQGQIIDIHMEKEK